MSRLIATAILFSLFCSSGFATTHCGRDEVTYFSCKIRGSAKVVSLCGSSLKNFDPSSFRDGGWIQYRFGRPNGSPEFIYPIEKTGSPSHFVGEAHSYLGEQNRRSYNHRVWFRNQKASYGLVADEGDDHFVGVWVAIGGKRTSLPCDTAGNNVDFGLHNSDGSTFKSLISNLPPIE